METLDNVYNLFEVNNLLPYGFFIGILEQISHIILVFLFLTLIK